MYIFNISRGYIDVRRILNSDIILVILVDCVLCYSYYGLIYEAVAVFWSVLFFLSYFYSFIHYIKDRS